ncbi:MAG: HAMP domain-containing sensor histidine kinase [Kofleriaceae bacterium]
MVSADGGDRASIVAGPALARAGAVWHGTRNELILATGRANVAFSAVVGVIASALISFFLWRAHYPTWRIVVPVFLFVDMVAAQFFVFRWAERRQVNLERAFVFLHALSQLYLFSVTTVTGGLYSPVMPVLGASTALPIIFFGATPVSRWLTVTSLALFVGMAAIPRRYLGPSLPHAQYATVAVVSFVWTALIVTTFVRRIYQASVQAAATVDELSEERVAVAAEQMCRLQSVGAKVAHELKNPLASVKGLVQLLARGASDGRTRERLDVAQSEIARMELILAEYLSFSRPLEDLRPRPLALAELVADVVAVISGRAEHARLEVKVDAQPAQLTADRRRLKEALLNLLANAIEATPAGGAITVRCRSTEDGGGVVEVADTGRGIKPDELARLGTSFFTTRDGGTGLGVVLAQSVVAQHGGTISYASAVGKGTTVTVRLPPAPPADGARGHAA